MSEKQQEQDNDSTQQLYNDWLQLCFTVGTTTTSTTTKNVKNEAKIAFQLFTDSIDCNIDEKLALLIKELNPAFVVVSTSSTGSVASSDLINKHPFIIQQKENDNHNNPTAAEQNDLSTMQSRLSALQCLSGALEGIVLSITTNKTITTRKANITISLNFINLFGTFLLQHCGPILIDDNNNDNNTDIDMEDKIRDEAIYGLNLLVQLLPLTLLHNEASKSISAESESESDSVISEKILKTILLFGQSGLEKRCCIKDDDDDEVDDYDKDDDDDYYDTNDDPMETDTNNPKNHTTSTNYRVGLSTLSRSRRTLLFNLLHSCIQAIGTTCCSNRSSSTTGTSNSATRSTSNNSYSKNISTSIMTELVQFVIICIDCLHGESDPRCLIQLLTLFHTMLIVLHPIFLVSTATTTANTTTTTSTTTSSITDSGSTTNKFPIYIMFNAISLYYPIQFNPPPNNIHNITKKTLRDAILLLMSCTLYETTSIMSTPTTVDDTESTNTSKGSMIRLSINIIVEALVSPDNDDDNNTVKELMDVLDDLNTCLFGINTDTNKENNNNKANIQYLTAIDMKKISDALITVHDIYTQRVSDSNSNDVEFNLNKELVTKCRIIISHIAYETEQLLIKCPILWQSFVQKPLRTIISLNDVSITSSSIVSSRIAIAYIANICSCGGIETLRYGLQIGLQPLLQTLQQQAKNNTTNNNTNVISIDDYCIALNAVGAYFSSARVTLSSSIGTSSTNKHNFTIKSSHPLQPYTSDALETIVTILQLSSTTEQNVKICALKAFECIVTVAPVDQFTTKTIQQTKQVIQSLSTNLLAESNSCNNQNNDHTNNDDSFDSDKKEWLLACARSIGSFLSMTANASNDMEHAVIQTIFYSPEIKEFLRNDVLLVLLKSVEQPNTNPNINVRYDREVVSTTCEQSIDVAKLVITSLMTSLLNYIEQRDDVHALATTESLHYILQQKDSFSCIVFQETTPSIFDLLDALVPTTNDIPVVDDDVMYKLQLPPSSDDQIRVQETLTRASMIVQYLRVVYSNNTNHNITSQHLQRLVKYVESSLPPLSEYDFNRTYIVLPLLSSALRNSHTAGRNDTSEQVSIQTRQLLQSMTVDLADIAINSSNLIAREHAAHCIYASIAYFSINTSDCNAAKVAKDTVVPSLQYDIGTCTIKETGNKLRDVDKVIRKVTDSFSMLSLLGAAAAIRGGTSNPTVDGILRFFLNLSNIKSASYPFISSSEQTGLDLKILDAGTNTTLNSTFLSAKAASAFGMLLTCAGQAPIRKQRLCHIAMKQIKDMKLQSENPLLSLGTRIAIAHIACCIDIRSINAQDMTIIIDILLSSLSTDALEESTTLAVKSLKLTLTSVMKLLHSSTTTLDSKLYIVVTGVMRAFAYTNEMDCKLLSLQILGTVAKLEDVSDVLKKLKAPVTSILAVSMNQSSVLLRQAAVKVRNDWFLVE